MKDPQDQRATLDYWTNNPAKSLTRGQAVDTELSIQSDVY